MPGRSQCGYTKDGYIYKRPTHSFKDQHYLETISSILLTIVNLDDFEARSPDELSLRKGERIELIERDDDFGDGWYLGKHIQNGKTGLFPEGKIFTIVGIARRLTL